MLKNVSIIAVALLLALPALASAQGSGLDAYTEDPPSADGDGGETGTPGAGTADPDAATPATGGEVAGNSASAGTDGLTEAQAGRQGDGDRPGELPASGLDETLVMALVGACLVALGFGIRRLAPPASI